MTKQIPVDIGRQDPDSESTTTIVLIHSAMSMIDHSQRQTCYRDSRLPKQATEASRIKKRMTGCQAIAINPEGLQSNEPIQNNLPTQLPSLSVPTA